jgi:hypothetical protein
MRIPKQVQQKIDLLNDYEIDNKLDKGNIFHLYKTKLAYPNGFYDSYFFKIHMYNTGQKKKRIFETEFDAIRLYQLTDYDIFNIGIYADGSTYIEFRTTHTFMLSQCFYIN